MRPNVVLINCDDLGYGDLGCYGSTLHATPALDRMAAEGLRLDSFYMASPVCSPSRGALLTGCYPPRIGFGDFDGLPVLFPGQAVGLAPSEVTLARLLSDAGYRTAMVGKWHCGDQPAFLPTDHGFDSFFGLPYSNDMGRQAGHPDRRPRSTSAATHRCRCCSTTRCSNSSPTRRRSRPLPRPRPSASSASPLTGRSSCTSPTCTFTCRSTSRSASPGASRNGAYGAAVETIDWVTAVLLHELRARGLDESTIVVFTSDNGSRGRRRRQQRAAAGRQGNDVGGRDAGAVHRALARPRRARAHERRAASSIDLYPTLAALCGADAADGPDHRRRRHLRRCCSTTGRRRRATRSGTT